MQLQTITTTDGFPNSQFGVGSELNILTLDHFANRLPLLDPDYLPIWCESRTTDRSIFSPKVIGEAVAVNHRRPSARQPNSAISSDSIWTRIGALRKDPERAFSSPLVPIRRLVNTLHNRIRDCLLLWRLSSLLPSHVI